MNNFQKITLGVAFASLVIGVAPLHKASAATMATTSQNSFSQQTQIDYNSLVTRFNALKGKYFGLWNYGQDIKTLQKSLLYLGYQPGSADGIFGPRTSKSLSSFEIDHGMKVTGLFNINSFYAIRYALQVNPPETSQPVINQPTYNNSTGNVNNNPAPVSLPTSAPINNNLTPVVVPVNNPPVANYVNGISQQDINLLAHVVYGEARGESFEGQVAVAAVVLNRLKSPIFPKTISGIVYDPWGFTCVNDGQINLTPNNQAYSAVDAAIKGWDPTNGALYYWNPVTATSPWVWTRTIVRTIGNHVFAK